jgi:PKD repeat protein
MLRGNGTIFVWSNRAPMAAFSATPNPATVGATVSFNASASSDPENDGRVYDWVFGDGATAITVNNPVTTHAYATPGLFTASLEVTDSFGATSPAVTVNISVTAANQPPVANPQSLSTPEDTALSITLTGSDPDGNPLSYAVVGGPMHGTLSGTAPALTYTPAANYFGSDSFTFKVNDGTVDSAPATISLTVTSVNDAPVLASPGNQSVNELALLSFALSATDADVADTLAYSISAGNLAGMNLVAATGAFTWTPTEAQGPGAYSVTFRATDNGSPALFNEKTVTITVGEVNTAPVLANPGDKTVNEGALLAFALSASDADLPANALTYSIQSGQQAGMALDANTGAFTWTPGEAQGPAVYPVVFRVSDAGGLFDEKTISITVNEVNVAPVLANPGDKSVNEGALLAFALSGSDADLPANALTYSIQSGQQSGMVLDATSGAFTWTPAESQGPGVYSVTFRVTDAGGLFNEKPISITVSEVNTAPVLASPGDKTVVELSQLAFSLSATDSDLPANTLTYAIQSGQQSGMTLDATTGAFAWTPNAAQGPNSYSVTFRATDSGGLFNEKTITITVTEPVSGPTDVTAQLQINRGGFRLVRGTQRYAQTITFTNTGGQAIAGPVSFVLDQLSANATVQAPSGTTSAVAPAGSPFINVNVGGDGILTAGETVSFTLEFSNPSNQAIAYVSRVLAGPGAR